MDKSPSGHLPNVLDNPTCFHELQDVIPENVFRRCLVGPIIFKIVEVHRYADFTHAPTTANGKLSRSFANSHPGLLYAGASEILNFPSVMITSRACIFRVPRSWPSSETQFSDTGVNVPNSVIPSPPATPKKKYSDSVNLLYVPPPPFIAGSRRHSPRTHAESSMITPAFYVLHLQHLSRLPSSIWDFVVTRWKWHQMLGAYTRASCPFL